MYGDMDKLDEMREKINSVSSSFCLAKWMHATIHLGTGKTHSCYLPPTHKIPLKEIKIDPSSLHNTTHKKEVRKMMMKGERPSECSICWSIEDLPGEHLSDRHYRSIDSWTIPYFEKIKNSDPSTSINPSYLEVSFSNTCNLKCTYCSPASSNEWLKEIKKEGPYELVTENYQDLEYFKREGEMPLEEEGNPYIEAFWKWWPDLVNDLMYFRITGGEPLLSPQTFKILEALELGPREKLNLSVNSNMSLPEKPLKRFNSLLRKLTDENKIREHILHVSLDTYGEQAEYIRDGLDFKVFEKNVENYLEEVPKGHLAIMCTFNNLSLSRFEQFLEWTLSLRKRYQTKDRSIFLDIPHLQFPKHQSVQILPKNAQDKMLLLIGLMQRTQSESWGFRKGEVLKMQRILEWMKEISQESPEDAILNARRDFFLFFKEKDRRRGTNFLETFPEMKDFWQQCQELNT